MLGVPELFKTSSLHDITPRLLADLGISMRNPLVALNLEIKQCVTKGNPAVSSNPPTTARLGRKPSVMIAPYSPCKTMRASNIQCEKNIYVYVYAYVYVYVYVFAYVYAYAYVYVHVHTYIRTFPVRTELYSLF